VLYVSLRILIEHLLVKTTEKLLEKTYCALFFVVAVDSLLADLMKSEVNVTKTYTVFLVEISIV
jgi:hypothetical protein